MSNSVIKKPEFFIIGAPKCGTTSLYAWLKEHPDLFMPDQKEPHYFAQNLSDRYCRVRDEREYLNLFMPAQESQKCGEASVLYSFYRESLINILKFNPTAKIIYMLRNPVEMAPSYHAQLLVNLEEDVKDFEAAWSLQEHRKVGGALPKNFRDLYLLQYRQVCALGMHLRDLHMIVPEGQFLPILLEDLANNPKATYTKILNFLDVKCDARLDFFKVNEGTAIKSHKLEKLRTSDLKIVQITKNIIKKIVPHHKIENFNRTKKLREKLSDSFIKELLISFESDIEIIEEYMKRDLSHWRDL